MRLLWHGDGVEGDRAIEFKCCRRVDDCGYELARIAVDSLARHVAKVSLKMFNARGSRRAR